MIVFTHQQKNHTFGVTRCGVPTYGIATNPPMSCILNFVFSLSTAKRLASRVRLGYSRLSELVTPNEP